MTTEEMVALIKASRDWAKALPKHPQEDAIGAHMQDFFSRQDAFLLRAYAARPGAEPAPRFSEIPGIVRGYWFLEDEEIPHDAPGYAPFAALLAPRPKVDLPPHLVLVRGLPDWITVSGAAVGTYRFADSGVAQFVSWEEGQEGRRTILRVRFVLLDADQIAYLFGPEAAERCTHGRRVLAAVNVIPQLVNLEAT